MTDAAFWSLCPASSNDLESCWCISEEFLKAALIDIFSKFPQKLSCGFKKLLILGTNDFRNLFCSTMSCFQEKPAGIKKGFSEEYSSPKKYLDISDSKK